MTDKTAYEHGARELKPLKGPDPNDEFSQKAAENKKPPSGMGLTEKSYERSETDKSDLTDSEGGTPASDAQGQSEKRHAGGSNDGVSSANPRVLSGNEDGDATFPLQKEALTGDPAMNVANLQIEGLLIAIASLNNTLVRKGILSVNDIDVAMDKAEANVTGEERNYEDMSPANRDAMCFPIRLLKAANLGQSEDHIQSFSELARSVGLTKEPYNDQR